ncbi:alcohol dehydrogenase [Devosia limi DSM 17137]|uniref:Alcohol dehydrogenase n=1 Tax=Devosia limi DSM 17137 TaxID=1121477 RepID=A0A0F5LWK8_9HYPH|nr:aldo/keto reductase [Devosia limi]KKB86760.1 alcohol dehydrogenase [Devosia limi DSM 17137]SHF33665.1 Predicted oxidoreductase [Devosia limi DSM 17137]
MDRRPLGRSELVIEPLVLGGNVFGWTVDRDQGFAVLDAFVGEGFTAIDTADVYGKGKSETMIGEWLKARGNREGLHIFTKVGSEMAPDKKGLKAGYVKEAVEASLQRLQTDYIDLYQSHRPDPETPHEETLEAYDGLIRAGKVRVIGSSNFTPAMIRAAHETAVIKSLPRYETEQPEYNLYDRSTYEGELQDLAVAENIGIIPYFSLAAGFLTGKYRSAADFGKSQRGGRMERYLNDKGFRILKALDAVSAANEATPAEVSLAWLVAQKGVSAPIASATSVEQVKSLARGVRLKLSEADLRTLTEAGK